MSPATTTTASVDGGLERRVQPAQRAAVDDVGDDLESQVRQRRGLDGDDPGHDPDRREHRQLALDDRHAAHLQQRLGAAAEPAGPSPGENGRRPGARHASGYATRMTTDASDDGIGRLLVASLHQAIGDAMPMRLEYYEHWLGPMGLRDRRGGLAPLNAVLSFLRQEGQPVYDDIMTRAGRASAEWHHLRRPAGAAAGPGAAAQPRRRATRSGGGNAWCGRPSSRPAPGSSARRGRGEVEISGSVFCTLRDPWPWPTCTYFASAIQRHLELCGSPAAVRIEACRAAGADPCRLAVDFTRGGADA